MNTYGVTIPGAPLPVEAYNNFVGWAFTNTGSDQIDFLRLTVDESRTRYMHNGEWRDLEVIPDTIYIKGGDPVIEKRYYSHWGLHAWMNRELLPPNGLRISQVEQYLPSGR